MAADGGRGDGEAERDRGGASGVPVVEIENDGVWAGGNSPEGEGDRRGVVLGGAGDGDWEVLALPTAVVVAKGVAVGAPSDAEALGDASELNEGVATLERDDAVEGVGSSEDPGDWAGEDDIELVGEGEGVGDAVDEIAGEKVDDTAVDGVVVAVGSGEASGV